MTISNAHPDTLRTVAAQPAGQSSSWKSLLYRLSPYLIAALITIVVLIPVWHLNRIDLKIPLRMNGDNKLAQAFVANFVRTGHYYVNPQLGAPGRQELFDFPTPHWTHISSLYIVKIFTRDPGLALNLWFFLCYPVITLTTLFALRRLGVSTALAIAGAVLYSFTPYRQLRNEGHLFYAAYYLVPLMAMVAVWVSTGRPLFRFSAISWRLSRWISREGAISIAVCALTAWDTPYDAFFGAVLLAVAALYAHFRFPESRNVLAAGILITVLVVLFFICLSPNLIYIHQHGRVPIAHRLPSESETYALTLIQMFAPVTNHRIPQLARWKDSFNGSALLVNENDTATLGIVGAAGCIVLFLCLFIPKPPEVLFSISILNLSAFLVGTMGGLGAVLSFVISPQLRAFNRVSIFISFFCLSGALIFADRYISTAVRNKKLVAYRASLAAILLIIGLYDEIPRGLMLGRHDLEAQYQGDAEFVRQIESMVPPDSMILTLPFDPYPESGPIQKMEDYDELRGYLHSKTLRWSYGAMNGRATSDWVATISAEPVDKLLPAIASSGFAGIFIDRAGYADRGVAIEGQIADLLGAPPITDTSGQLSFFTLDKRAIAVLNTKLQPENRVDPNAVAAPIVIGVGAGCYGREVLGGQDWHWCSQHGAIEILNTSSSPRTVVLEANFSTFYPELSELEIDGLGLQQKMKINGAGTSWQQKVTLPPGESTIKLSSNANAVQAPTDPRDMHFRVNNLRVHEQGRQ